MPGTVSGSGWGLAVEEILPGRSLRSALYTCILRRWQEPKVEAVFVPMQSRAALIDRARRSLRTRNCLQGTRESACRYLIPV